VISSVCGCSNRPNGDCIVLIRNVLRIGSLAAHNTPRFRQGSLHTTGKSICVLVTPVTSMSIDSQYLEGLGSYRSKGNQI